MKTKKLAVKLGRKIRRETGIPFGDAMRLGKIFARSREYDRGYTVLGERTSVADYFFYRSYHCDCCGGYDVITGPKGELQFHEVRA